MALSNSLIVCLLLNLPATALDGGDQPSLDRQVFDILKELNNRGADLNNAGDTIGCYRYYQGGLSVLKSCLGQRPAAQKIIEDGLKAADRRPLPERAFSLHTTITELRAVFKPAATPAKPASPDPNAPPASFPADPKLPMPNPVLPKPAGPTNPPVAEPAPQLPPPR